MKKTLSLMLAIFFTVGLIILSMGLGFLILMLFLKFIVA